MDINRFKDMDEKQLSEELVKLREELDKNSDTLVELVKLKVNYILNADKNIDKVRDVMTEIENEIRFITDEIACKK